MDDVHFFLNKDNSIVRNRLSQNCRLPQAELMSSIDPRSNTPISITFHLSSPTSRKDGGLFAKLAIALVPLELGASPPSFHIFSKPFTPRPALLSLLVVLSPAILPHRLRQLARAAILSQFLLPDSTILTRLLEPLPPDTGGFS